MKPILVRDIIRGQHKELDHYVTNNFDGDLPLFDCPGINFEQLTVDN